MSRDRTEAQKQNEARGREVAWRTHSPDMLDGAGQETDPMVFTRERSITEVSTSAFDKKRVLVGSSAFQNDASSTGLTIDAAPSTINNRDLFQLAGLSLTSYEACRIVGIRQYVDLLAEVQQLDNQGALIGQYDVSLPVTTPLWSFPDGNVSWHLRFNRGPNRAEMNATNVQRPNETNTIGNTGSALVFQSQAPYVVGRMVGDPVGSLGTIRDMRFPWNQQSAASDIDYVIQGPGVLILYASVKQTNPATRSLLQVPVGFDVGCLPPEDRFILSMSLLHLVSGVRYGKIAGSIIAEIGAIERRPGIERVTGDTPS